jgi:hypothetical protein
MTQWLKSIPVYYKPFPLYEIISIRDATELRGRVWIAEAKARRLELAVEQLTNQIQAQILKEYIDAK